MPTFEKPTQNKPPRGQSYPLEEIPPVRPAEEPTVGNK